MPPSRHICWPTLENHFTQERLLPFPQNKWVVLFGEGYGPKIQAAGPSYREDVGFMLFDVVVDRWWLTREGVASIGSQLDLPVPPNWELCLSQRLSTLLNQNHSANAASSHK